MITTYVVSINDQRRNSLEFPTIIFFSTSYFWAWQKVFWPSNDSVNCLYILLFSCYSWYELISAVCSADGSRKTSRYSFHFSSLISLGFRHEELTFYYHHFAPSFRVGDKEKAKGKEGGLLTVSVLFVSLERFIFDLVLIDSV